MNKMLVFMLSACLFANEHVETIGYLTGAYVVLNEGMVLEVKGAEYQSLLKVDEDVHIKKNGNHLFIASDVEKLQLPCKYIGNVKDKLTMVSKVFARVENGHDLMVELGDGDLFVIPDGANSSWSVGSCVLKVESERGIYLLDFLDGSLDYVSHFGMVNTSRDFDIVVDVPELWVGKECETQLVLDSFGVINSQNSILGNFDGWHDGDEVVIQQFSSVEFAVKDSVQTLFLFHNVTQNKLAVGSRA